jgi:hypothetical protein
MSFQKDSYFSQAVQEGEPDDQMQLADMPERTIPVGLILGRILEAKPDPIEVSRRELEEWKDDLLHCQDLAELDLIVDAISDKLDR